MSNINFWNVLYRNSVNGYRLNDGLYEVKSGIYINSEMYTESGMDEGDTSKDGSYYISYSLDGGNTYEYKIGFYDDHDKLGNLDFDNSGHIGFAGTDVSNTFTENNTFTNTIFTNLIQSIDTSDLYVQSTNGVYLGTKGQDSVSSTLYVNDIISARTNIDMNNNKIINVFNPSNNLDAVNLQFLNTTISNLYPESYKLMLSGSDTAGYLNTKLLEGNGIDFVTATETITVNADIESTTVGGYNLFKNGYTVKQLLDSDYIKIDETDDSLKLNFDYSNFSMTTIWQDAVLDFTILNDIVTTSFVGGERYINTSLDGGYVINSIYTWDIDNTVWVETSSDTGFATWVNDEDLSDDKGYWSYNGSSWVRFGGSLSHNTLSNKDGGDGSVFYHLSDSERVSLTTGTNTTLHYHSALRDSNNDIVASVSDGAMTLTNSLVVDGAETSVVLKDTNTGTDIVVSNIGSELVVDNNIKANGIDVNNNKVTNVANPTEALDAVNLATLVSVVGTSIIKISDSVVANTTKTLEQVAYTNGCSFKYMYSISDDSNNSISGEINVIADTTDVDTSEYAVLKLGDESILENYYFSIENDTANDLIELKLLNTDLTRDIDVNVIRININIG